MLYDAKVKALQYDEKSVAACPADPCAKKEIQM
jgi:hypothetical protein